MRTSLFVLAVLLFASEAPADDVRALVPAGPTGGTIVGAHVEAGGTIRLEPVIFQRGDQLSVTAAYRPEACRNAGQAHLRLRVFDVGKLGESEPPWDTPCRSPLDDDDKVGESGSEYVAGARPLRSIGFGSKVETIFEPLRIPASLDDVYIAAYRFCDLDAGVAGTHVCSRVFIAGVRYRYACPDGADPAASCGYRPW